MTVKEREDELADLLAAKTAECQRLRAAIETAEGNLDVIVDEGEGNPRDDLVLGFLKHYVLNELRAALGQEPADIGDAMRNHLATLEAA